MREETLASFAADHNRSPFEKASAAEPTFRGRVLIVPPEIWGSQGPNGVAEVLAKRGIEVRYYTGEEVPPLDGIDLIVFMLSSAYLHRLAAIGDAARARKIRHLFANADNMVKNVCLHFNV